MAKYYSSTFGKISGKHGNAVAVIRQDGSTYLRIYKKPSNPRTDKQQAHRAKFALSSRALVPFNPIFKTTIGVTNGISTARSYAFRNAIEGEYPSLSMNYEKLMFSFGPIERLHNTSFGINEGVVSLCWDFQKMYNCNANDSVSLVVFNKGDNQAVHIEDVALRSDKTVDIDIRDSWAGADLYLWAYVTSGDKISDSVFVSNSVGIDPSACSENKSIDNKHIDLSVRFDFNKFIMAYVMMLYNLFGLLYRESLIFSNGFANMFNDLLVLTRQKVHAVNIRCQVSSLIYSLFASFVNLGSTYKGSSSLHNLNIYRRPKFEVLRL